MKSVQEINDIFGGKTVEVVNGKKEYLLPKYADDGSSGMDLRAAISEPVVLQPVRIEYSDNMNDLPSEMGDMCYLQVLPGDRKLIPTELSVAIPDEYEIQIRPRSGLALKHGIMVVNSPGTIDASYRGKIGVILMNSGSNSFTVNPGDRIAQAVLCKVEKIHWQQVDKLSGTERGSSGFGSTGQT